MTLIRTERLYLRELMVEDIGDQYVMGLNDPEVVGLTEARHSVWTREKVEAYVLESNIPGQSLLLGVFLSDCHRHIGNVRLFNFCWHRRAELGIMIFDKSCWSKGYGSEAIIGVVDYAFEKLGLHRIVADYYAINTGSARMFAKAGFVVEGVFKDHFWLDGRYVDSVRIAKIQAPHGE